MPRKPIVGGNWKCNPAETAKLKELVANYDGASEVLADCDVYVCPSNLHVGLVYDKFKDGVMVAPQNCNFKVRPGPQPSTVPCIAVPREGRGCPLAQDHHLSGISSCAGLRCVHRRDGR